MFSHSAVIWKYPPLLLLEGEDASQELGHGVSLPPLCLEMRRQRADRTSSSVTAGVTVVIR